MSTINFLKFVGTKIVNLKEFKTTFIRYLNTSNYRFNLSQTSQECPKKLKSHIKDSNEFHCTPEEWNIAKPFDSIPGPKPLPVIGNNWRFLPYIGEYSNVQNNVVDFLTNINKQFGDVVILKNLVGLKEMVYLFNPSDFEMVYKIEGVMPERDLFPSIAYFRQNMRQDIFKDTKGLVASQGEDWYAFRSKVNSIMMQPKMIKQYIHPVDCIAKELMTRIKSIRNENNKITLDFWKEINKWSLESISYLALNNRLGCLHGNFSDDSDPAKMIHLAEEVFTYGGKLDFEPSLWRQIPTPTYKKAMKAYNDQTVLIEKLIKQSIKNIKDKNSKQTNDNSEEPSVLEKILKIDENIAFIMALDMIIAGVDTTSTTLINTLFYLASNKSTQEILRKEISALLPNKDSELNIEILNSMSYLKACIKEASRLYPIGVGSLRNLTKNAVISGYRMPKGTILFFNHMCVSMDEKYYKRPQEYLPERWLKKNSDSDISYKKAHPFCSMPFGFGSRSCIGRRFAELELEVVLINFIRNFDLSWEGPPPGKAKTLINFLVGPFNFVFKDIE